jgi:hypothetical protein
VRESDHLTTPVRVRTVIHAWWPLAASWLLMGLELPAVSAGMARLPDSTVSLAAYGGVVFPLSLLIEAPIIMLLAASTALARDWPSYRLVRRFMYLASSVMTALHVLVAFTPLYDVVVGRLLHAPADILEPGRRGLMIMTPWTLSIAYRRTQQGVMIRFGRSWAVGVGTVLRLAANLFVLGIGAAIGTIPGIVVGSAAVAAGVISEAVLSGILVQPVLKHHLRTAPPAEKPLTLGAFLRFYAPLAATPVIAFLAMPLASAAMGRMPRTLESLAAWPVVNGLTFTLRSVGFALNEVVVALLDRPHATQALKRFTFGLATLTSAALLLTAVTPLGTLWFVTLTALPIAILPLARVGLALSIAAPALSALQSWYQGVIVHSRRTRGVTESVVVYLLTIAAILGAGIAWGHVAGLWVAIVALIVGNATQVLWLRSRGRHVIRAFHTADAARLAPIASPTPAEATEPAISLETSP